MGRSAGTSKPLEVRGSDPEPRTLPGPPFTIAESGSPEPRRILKRLLGGRLMRVSGDSMAPTLRSGALIFVNTRTYRRRAPQCGEIVAARPKAFGGKTLVKRLAGLPRQQVEISGRWWQLNDDQFFLLGDCPDQSTDSRNLGPVDRHELLGVVTRSIWPWRSLKSI